MPSKFASYKTIAYIRSLAGQREVPPEIARNVTAVLQAHDAGEWMKATDATEVIEFLDSLPMSEEAAAAEKRREENKPAANGAYIMDGHNFVVRTFVPAKGKNAGETVAFAREILEDGEEIKAPYMQWRLTPQLKMTGAQLAAFTKRYPRALSERGGWARR